MDAALALEFHEDVFHEIAGLGFPEDAGAVAFIQPFLDALGEAAAKLEFLFLGPWLRVLLEEDLAAFT